MKKQKPEYIFETAWEVCNKVGGIHTVLSTKALSLLETYHERLILIGPDLNKGRLGNLEFEEDRSLFSSWKESAVEAGLRIRIGRWKIVGKPIAILVDFTNKIEQKDKIFTQMWENYGVDSITGQWDYIEPAIFGYAAGEVIKHFVSYNLSARHRVLAHFHEWMTGSGILYLKKEAPWIATAFTTHATIMGRTIAGNNLPLYNNLNKFNPGYIARDYNIVSKWSLEKQSGVQADCFTTVSDITARESHYLLETDVDIVTPNGFEPGFVPKGEEFTVKRNNARNKIFDVVKLLYNTSIEENTIIVTISGRYEFGNKGVDLFLDAINRIKKQADTLSKKIIPLILIPAGNTGACNSLLERINKISDNKTFDHQYLTHCLADIVNDPIVNTIEKYQLHKTQNIYPLFVPTYLDGNDGIFNLSYYDLFIGSDLGVFPSYYEPWGYTPLESLAFKIPTITTDLAGFGQWIQNENVDLKHGAVVIKRNDTNKDEVAQEISKQIINYSKFSEEDVVTSRNNAQLLCEKALWKNLISNYFDAYDIALKKSNERFLLNRPQPIIQSQIKKSQIINNQPKQKKFIIQSQIPAELVGLSEISQNIWWTWNFEAIQLFKSMDQELWYKGGRNPITLLNQISTEKLNKLISDSKFIDQYNKVYSNFKSYVDLKSESKPTIAYFCMEYGFYDKLKIYSGGLGILAGDYLKEASDNRLRLVSVGFLYKYGYFKQHLTSTGEQQASRDMLNFNELPVKPLIDEHNNPILVEVIFPGRTVFLKVWTLNVGRNPLYLLDSDVDYNNPEDRQITHQLYGGNWENRLKQEILLGYGGSRLLRHLGYKIDVFHLNEGHASFLNLERITHFVTRKRLSYNEAIEVVRKNSLFTTHTPVPAGHDVFTEDMLRVYFRQVPEELGISWEQLMNLGKMNPSDKFEKFSMSVLAANTCSEINGVSELHGKVSREMFQKIYFGFFADELHISHVTNGVHYSTWTAKEWKKLHNKYLAPDFHTKLDQRDLWKKIYEVPDNEIWNIRQLLRKKLIDYIKERFNDNWKRRNDNPSRIIKIINNLDDKALTIGFARRFATYKRAHLLFKDIDRLSKIVNNPDYPVQFIFAGKAHPADKAGQDLIKHIVEISHMPQFIGKILFIENYDIQLAKRLVKGVDVWLNTPTRPLEASGTSGEKAAMNGILNFSVLDGWWREGYKENAGWALTDQRTYENQGYQDEIDAINIYSIFENEIIPLFYNRNENNIPTEWIKYIKNNLAFIAPEFTTKRMIQDYINKFYKPLCKSYKEVSENNYLQAIEIALWKQKMINAWNEIEIVSVDFPNTAKHDYLIGQTYHGEIMLDLHSIKPDDIGVDMVIADDFSSMKNSKFVYPLKFTSRTDNLCVYSVDIQLNIPGVFEYGLRLYPKNEKLRHKMDFNMVRWIE